MLTLDRRVVEWLAGLVRVLAMKLPESAAIIKGVTTMQMRK